MSKKTASWKLGATAAVVWGCMSAGASAKEPFSEFLDGLRNRGMYDAAVMYCQEMGKRSNLDPKIKAVLPFEEGQSLLDGAADVKDIQLRFDQLDLAAGKFRDFIKANKEHDLLPFANTNLGQVLAERAKAKLEEGKRPNKAAQKPALTKEAADLFAQATKAMDDANKLLQEKRKKIKEAAGKNAKFDDEFKAQVLRAELLTGMVRYQHSQAYEKKDPLYKKTLEDAAAKFHVVVETRRNYTVGLIAAIYEAKCWLELGTPNDLKKALAIVDQIVVNAGDEPDRDLRLVQAQAMRIKMAAMVPDDEKDVAKVNEAIKTGEALTNKMKPNEDAEPDWLALQWAVVRLHQKRIALDAKTKVESEKRMRLLARNISKHPGDFRDDARKVLAALGDQPSGPPTDFATAWDAATELSQNLAVLQEAVKEAKSPADKKTAQAKYEGELKKTFAAAQLALALRNAGTEKATSDQINKARYLSAVILFQQEKYHAAQVAGEYIARKHPDSADARSAANLTLAAMLRTYGEGLGGDRDVEAKQLDSMATYILERWPEDKAAETARVARIETALYLKNYAALPDLIKAVPESSEQRGAMEIKVGNALWVQYVKLSRLEDGAEAKPTPEKLASMLKESQEFLEKGLEREKAGADAEKPKASALLAGLYLTQLYSRTGQNQKAIKILEEKKVGLLDVLANDPEAKEIPGLAAEVYKVGLQTYVRERSDAQSDKMMKALEDSFKDDPAAADKLTAVYYRLGVELKEDLERQLKAKQTKEFADTLSSAEAFYSRVAARDNNTFNTLNLVGETLYSLGESSRAEGNLDNAKRLFAQARTAFEKMVNQTSSDWWPVKDPAKLKQYKALVEIKIAKCARATGEYDKAAERLAKVVFVVPSSLDVQKEWALTQQEQGDSKKDLKAYNKAMVGASLPDPANPKTEKKVFWGWNQMAKITGKNPAMREAYHEAWYNLVQCLFRSSEIEDANKSPKSKDTRTKAIYAVKVMLEQFPDAGGEEWFAKYDSLLRRMQERDGVASKDQGIKVFREKSEKEIAAAPKSASLAAAPAATAAESKAADTKVAKAEKPAEPVDMTSTYIGVGVASLAMLGGIGWFVVSSSKKTKPIGLKQDEKASFDMPPEGA